MATKKPDSYFIERFWSQVSADGCWNWTGRRTWNGYGAFCARLKGQRFHNAHRFSYRLHIGVIPDGYEVCHSCDNRICVNPGHLWVGTKHENMADCVAKGRKDCGTRHHRNKLTEDQVLEAFDNRAVPHVEYARKFGVNASSIERIRNGTNWRWLLESTGRI